MNTQKNDSIFIFIEGTRTYAKRSVDQFQLIFEGLKPVFHKNKNSSDRIQGGLIKIVLINYKTIYNLL